MTLSIQLSDEEAAALRAQAAAEGLSLEDWIRRLAGQGPEPSFHPHIADSILENMRDVSPEIMASMPEDGASQHDHYIHGWPKKEE